jgi:hypothetical protein
VRKRRADGVRPVGVKQERRGAAIGEAEGVASRPFAFRHHLVQPAVRGVEHGARFCDGLRVALRLRTHAVVDDLLLRRRDVVVEETVHAAHFQRGAGVGRQLRHRPGMVQAQILDDDARLHHGPAAVDQHRKALDRPERGEFGHDLRVVVRQQAQFERRAVFVERGQDLLAVRGEGMGVELQGHRGHLGRLLILGALRRDGGQRAAYLTTNGSGVNRHL